MQVSTVLSVQQSLSMQRSEIFHCTGVAVANFNDDRPENLLVGIDLKFLSGDFLNAGPYCINNKSKTRRHLNKLPWSLKVNHMYIYYKDIDIDIDIYIYIYIFIYLYIYMYI